MIKYRIQIFAIQKLKSAAKRYAIFSKNFSAMKL